MRVHPDSYRDPSRVQKQFGARVSSKRLSPKCFNIKTPALTQTDFFKRTNIKLAYVKKIVSSASFEILLISFLINGCLG